MPEEEIYPILITYNGNYYEIDNEKNVTNIDSSEIFTITKIYDDNTTETQIVKKGNNYGLITYKKKDEQLFRGWSKSSDSFASSDVIDFMDVSENMTVFAHYVSKDYAKVHYQYFYDKSSNIIDRFYIMIARPMFSNSTGLVMKHDNITTHCDKIKIKDSMSFKVVIDSENITFTSSSLFGVTGYLGVFDIPISELSEGKEITFYQYYITKDGAKVEGDERNIIWHEKIQT